MATKEHVNRNARIAGMTFLLYYATALTDMWLFGRLSSRGGIGETLANFARHTLQLRLTVVFAMLTIIYALILAVTLYALTRDIDRELALMAFACRMMEGVLNAVPGMARIGLLSMASATPTPSLQVQAELLFKVTGWSGAVSGTIFAIGGTLFAYLFLKGRGIPPLIAWLGVVGSVIVIPIYFLRAFRMVSGSAVWLTSIPLIVFELTLALWLLIKGVAVRKAGAQP